MNKIQIITGGQYGSEAKGTIAAHLVIKDRIDIAVRTGATNAGHTCEFNDKSYVVQQLPVGWIRPETKLVLGAGAIIDPIILERECDMIDAALAEAGIHDAPVRGRLFIDHRAYIHRREHAERSAASGRHHRIGATGKGCSEAVVDRIKLRGDSNWTVGDNSYMFNDYVIFDTEKMLNDAYDQGARIQIEGCQGTLLDLMLGPYPYTTHKQTTPANWMSECGLSPALPTDIVMVLRAMPIRVAGNSGPLDMETSWPLLARSINDRRVRVGMMPIVAESAINDFERAIGVIMDEEMTDHDKRFTHPGNTEMHTWSSSHRAEHAFTASELNKRALSILDPATIVELKKMFEFTTVTKKLRRIAYMSLSDVDTACRQVRPHRIAVTFMNYLLPEYWGDTYPRLYTPEIKMLTTLEQFTYGAPVTIINRGPKNEHVIDATARE